LCLAPLAWAQVAAVPAEIQAELVSKLETYDRGFVARAGSTAKVLIVVRSGNGKSELAAADTRAALAKVERVGGLPHQEVVVAYEGAEALAQRCRSEKAAIVYFTPGFDDELDALRKTLGSLSILTVGAPEYVQRGVVLGFELESGKTKIVINLEQAKLQGVAFPAEVLRLMKVYR
jgi:hypothetical protein